MVEGELKKRIKEIDFGLDALNEEFHPKIVAIIDEAKKEFLKVNPEKAIDEEYWEWFLKWFGE